MDSHACGKGALLLTCDAIFPLDVSRGIDEYVDHMSTESPPENPSARMSAAPPPTPAEADVGFVHSLRGAGLLEDLSDTLLQVFLERLGATQDADARRVDLLELYYQAGGDSELARRRVVQDRFLLHHGEDETSAHEIVRRLLALLPELPTSVRLERIGENSDDGPLVLRGGDHLSAVDDEEEEGNLDTGEIDLSSLEEQPTIAVRSLVSAVNVLLERHDVRRRLLLLRSDGAREVYVATGPTEAAALCKHGCLELEDPSELFEFAAW